MNHTPFIGDTQCGAGGTGSIEKESSLKPASEAFCAAHRVKVGPKTVTYVDKNQIVHLKFNRGVSNGGEPDFTISVTEDVPITEKCNMGHQHQTGRKSMKYGRIQLSWAQAEQLMDWFQAGTWREVRERRGQ